MLAELAGTYRKLRAGSRSETGDPAVKKTLRIIASRAPNDRMVKANESSLETHIEIQLGAKITTREGLRVTTEPSILQFVVTIT